MTTQIAQPPVGTSPLRDAKLMEHALHLVLSSVKHRDEASATPVSSCYSSHRRVRGLAEDDAWRGDAEPKEEVAFVSHRFVQISHWPECIRSNAGRRAKLVEVLQALGTHIAIGFHITHRFGQDVALGMHFEPIKGDQFAKFRTLLGIAEDQYQRSLTDLVGGCIQESGKSGSLFWFSRDGQCLLKSATSREFDKLLDMLPRYIAHFEVALASGRRCMLCRFLGAYCVRAGSQVLRLVVMDNLFADQKPDRIYDLKGTTEDRFVEPGPGRVMKDLNFEDSRLCLGSGEADALLGALAEDTGFLRSEGIMDYSLLLGVIDGTPETLSRHLTPRRFTGLELVEESRGCQQRPACFLMGLIDILVEWSFKKQAAYLLKKPTIGCCEEIDTEPPDIYHHRFMEYLEAKIVSAN